MKTFTWLPDLDHELENKPRIVSAKFGDGYEQRSIMGINPIQEKWSLNFSGPVSTANAIDSFLAEHKGIVSFVWKTPKGRTINAFCREWKRKSARGQIVTITCTFEEDFT